MSYVLKVAGIVAVALAAHGGEYLDAPRGPVVTIICGGNSNLFWKRKAPREYTPGTWAWDAKGKRWRRASRESGPDRLLIDALARKYPDLDFAAMEFCGAPASVLRNWQQNGRHFRTALRNISDARKAPQPAVLAGFVTMLGWCEVGGKCNGTPEYPTFEKDYIKFVSNFRNAVGEPDLPWLASRIEWGTKVPRDRVRRGGGAAPPMSDMSEEWKLVWNAFDSFPEAYEHLVVIPSAGIDLRDDHHFSDRGDEQWVQRAMKAVEEVDLMGYVSRKLAAGRKDGTLKVSADAIPQTADNTGPSSKKPVATVRAMVVRNSKGRSISGLGPYKHAMLTTEYRVMEVLDGKYEGERIITVQFGIKDRKYQPARNYQKGEIHELSVGPWDVQEKLQQLAMDDGIDDFDSEYWFVFMKKDYTGPRKPSARSMATYKEELMERVRHAVSDGRKVVYKDSRMRAKVRITSMDAEGEFTFRVVGPPITGQREWSAVPPGDLLAIALAVAEGGRPADHEVAAFFLLATEGKAAEAEYHMRLAGARDKVLSAFE